MATENTIIGFKYGNGSIEYDVAPQHLPEIEFGLPFEFAATDLALLGNDQINISNFRLMRFDGYQWNKIEDLELTDGDGKWPGGATEEIALEAAGANSTEFILWRAGLADKHKDNWKIASTLEEKERMRKDICGDTSQMARDPAKGPLQIWMTWEVTRAATTTPSVKVTFDDPWVPKPPQG